MNVETKKYLQLLEKAQRMVKIHRFEPRLKKKNEKKV